MLTTTIGALSTLLAAFLTTVNCEPPSSQYGTPLAPPINNYGGASSHINANHNYNEHDHAGPPQSYEFGYQVKDDYSGNNYNRQETSDGNQVKGEYRVALPDGRTQIVTYYADWKTGFHADVRYEGTASYPNQYNNNHNHYQASYNQPTNHYSAPALGNYNSGYNGNYNNGYNGGGVASSTVSIKDFSNGGTPYNVGNNYNNYNNQGFDSYSNAAVGFGNHHGRPSNAYGAP